MSIFDMQANTHRSIDDQLIIVQMTSMAEAMRALVDSLETIQVQLNGYFEDILYPLPSTLATYNGGKVGLRR